MAQVRVTVDGVNYADDVEPRMLLVHYLRERLGQDRHPRRLRHQQLRRLHRPPQRAEREVVLGARRAGRRRARSPRSRASPGTASCTRCRRRSTSTTPCSAATARPGMIMQAIDLLGDNPDPDEREVREGIEGNLCRCTGYQNIVRAVQSAAQKMKPGATRRRPTPRTGRRRRQLDDHDRRTHHTRDRQGPRPQGGRPPDHRPHPLHRHHHPARHAAHARRPLAARARDDHRHRHGGGQGGARASSASTPPPTSASRRSACPAPGRSPRT